MNQFEDHAAHLIAGRPVSEGNRDSAVDSIDPFDGTVRWTGASARSREINAAVAAARGALAGWARTPVAERILVVERFAELVRERSEDLASLVAAECGKPLWDAKTEVNSLTTKVAASLEAHSKRAADSSREVRGMISRTRFFPHGVMAVLGPFNFPMSMANSHIMPALLAGNTVVFKPSELTPLSGLVMTDLWVEAGLPAGAINCISGARTTGQELVSHPGIDGVLFIGSHPGGLAILGALAQNPEKIVALEMGGNNPLVVWDYDDVDVAAHIALQSTMISAGQRCSAARRLIIRRDDEQLVQRLQELLAKLRVGHFRDRPEPFYGPLIRPTAAAAVMARVDELVAAGARPLPMAKLSGPNQTLVSPCVLDMDNCSDDRDEEIFGPVLKLYRANSLGEAIDLANRTKFGLAAGLVAKNRAAFDEFASLVRAGIVNWNQQLTGATTFAPFGGIKQSGNYRPAGFLSADYCSYAVASFEVERPTLPETLSPGIEL